LSPTVNLLSPDAQSDLKNFFSCKKIVLFANFETRSVKNFQEHCT